MVDCSSILSCWKPPLHSAVQAVLGTVISSGKGPELEAVDQAQKNRFIVAFCGSGTGHLIQALSVVKILRKAGMELAGVVADTDANERMLKDMVHPLGVEVLTIPAIKLVDGEKGMVFLPLVLQNTLRAKSKLNGMHAEIVGFLQRAKASLVVTFWHITFAYFLQMHQLPPSVKVMHIAAQFAHTRLENSQLPSPIEVITKATMEFMAAIFARSGKCISITPRDLPDSLPPILEVPRPVETMEPRLILCYFLVQRDAAVLEKLLAKHGTGGAEFHCFTSKPLPKPKGRPLALNSHPKQRTLFQELFGKCTGVIVSTGNETVWEAVCRGVPVLTIPTADHGEQLLNAATHSANFPTLVRARNKLRIEDVRWVTEFKQGGAAIAESNGLREQVNHLADNGSPLLAPP